MKIKKGDKVIIIKGKDSGKSGKVINVIVKDNRIMVEALNLMKKNIKAKKQGEKGQIISVPASLNVSNVLLLCQSCGKPTRIGHRLTGLTKERICKSCKATN